MTDIHDAPTYCCDECGIPVVLADLVPFKRLHICRICNERLHPPAGRSTHRIEGNRLARSDTRFGDWPGPSSGAES